MRARERLEQSEETISALRNQLREANSQNELLESEVSPGVSSVSACRGTWDGGKSNS